MQSVKKVEPIRARSKDGYSPVVRDYDTGLPTQGVKVEEKKQKF